MADVKATFTGEAGPLKDALDDIKRATSAAKENLQELDETVDEVTIGTTVSSEAVEQLSNAIDDAGTESSASDEQVSGLSSTINDLKTEISELSVSKEADTESTEDLDDKTEQADRTVRSFSDSLSVTNKNISFTTSLKEKLRGTTERLSNSVEESTDEMNQQTASLGLLSGAALGTSGSMENLKDSVDDAGDEAGEAARDFTEAAGAAELLSLQSSALSINLGFFTIALRNLTTQIPILVTTVGNLTAAFGGLATAIGGVGIGGFTVALGGALAKAQEAGANLNDFESIMNSLEPVSQDVQEALLDAFMPVVEAQGAIALFDRLIQTLVHSVSDFSQVVADTFEGNFLDGSEEGMQSLRKTSNEILDVVNNNVGEIGAAVADVVMLLGDDLVSIIRTVAEGLPGFIRRLGVVTEQILSIVDDATGGVSKFVNELTRLGRTIGAGVAPVLSTFFTTIGEIVDALVLTQDEIDKTNGTLEEARRKFGALRVETIATAAKIGALLLAVNRIGGALGSLVGPLTGAAKALLSVGSSARESGGALQAFFKTISLGISRTLGATQGITKLAAAFEQILPPIGDSNSRLSQLGDRFENTSSLGLLLAASYYKVDDAVEESNVTFSTFSNKLRNIASRRVPDVLQPDVYESANSATSRLAKGIGSLAGKFGEIEGPSNIESFDVLSDQNIDSDEMIQGDIGGPNIGDKIAGFGNRIQNGVSNSVDSITSFIPTATSKIGDSLEKGLRTAFTRPVDAALFPINLLGEGIASGLEGLGNGIGTGITRIQSSVSNLDPNIGNRITSSITPDTSFDAQMAGVASGLNDVSDDIDNASESVSGFKSRFTRFVPNSFDSAMARVASGLNSVSDTISSASDSVTEFKGEIISFSGTAQKGFSDAVKFVRDFGADVRTEFRKTRDDIIKKVPDIENAIGDGFNNKINSALDSFNESLQSSREEFGRFTTLLGGSIGAVEFGDIVGDDLQTKDIRKQFRGQAGTLRNNVVSDLNEEFSGGEANLSVNNAKFENIKEFQKSFKSRYISPINNSVQQLTPDISLPDTNKILEDFDDPVPTISKISDDISNKLGTLQTSLEDFADSGESSTSRITSFFTKLGTLRADSFTKISDGASKAADSVDSMGDSMLGLSIPGTSASLESFKDKADDIGGMTTFDNMEASSEELGNAMEEIAQETDIAQSELDEMAEKVIELSGPTDFATATVDDLADEFDDVDIEAEQAAKAVDKFSEQSTQSSFAATLASIKTSLFSGSLASLSTVLTTITVGIGILAGAFVALVAVVGIAGALVAKLGQSGKSLSEVIDSLKQTVISLGQAALPFVVGATNLVLDIFNSLMEVGGRIIGVFKDIAVELGLMEESTGSSAGGFQGFLDTVESVSNGIQDLLNGVGSFVIEFAEGLIPTIESAGETFVNFLDDIDAAEKIKATEGLIKDISDAVGGLEGAMNLVITIVGDFVSGIIKISFILGVLTVAALAAFGGVSALNLALGALVGGITAVLSPFLSLPAAIIAVTVALVVLLEHFGFFDAIIRMIMVPINALINGFMAIVDVVMSVLGMFANLINLGTIIDVVVATVTALVDGFNILMNVIGSVVNVVMDIIGVLFDLYVNTLVLIYTFIYNKLVQAFNLLKREIINLINSIPMLKSGIQTIQSVMSELDKIIDGIIDGFMSLPSIIDGIFQDIIKFTQGFINDVIVEINKLIGAFNDKAENVPGVETMEKIDKVDLTSEGKIAESAQQVGEEAKQGTEIEGGKVKESDVSSGVATLSEGRDADSEQASAPGQNGNVTVNEGDTTNIFNQSISAEPEDEVQMGRIAEDAMQEANSFKRRQQGSQ